MQAHADARHLQNESTESTSNSESTGSNVGGAVSVLRRCRKGAGNSGSVSRARDSGGSRWVCRLRDTARAVPVIAVRLTGGSRGGVVVVVVILVVVRVRGDRGDGRSCRVGTRGGKSWRSGGLGDTRRAVPRIIRCGCKIQFLGLTSGRREAHRHRWR